MLIQLILTSILSLTGATHAEEIPADISDALQSGSTLLLLTQDRILGDQRGLLRIRNPAHPGSIPN